MIVDTSAIMAIVLNEPERQRFVHLLADATAPRISAGSWIALSAVLTRRRDPVADAALAMVYETITLAKATGEPLLYKGEGFALTDIPAAA